MANPTLRTAGSWVAANATTQTVTIPTHQTGDMLVVRVFFKHATMPTTVSCDTANWNKAGQDNSGATASSNGGGSVECAVFWKVAESGAETNPVIRYHASTAATPSAAVCDSYQNGGLPWETPQWTSGNISVATNFSATMEAHVTAQAGDLLIASVGTNDNTTLTVPTFTQTGLTLAAVVEHPATALSSATSNDISADGCYRIVNSGTSSAAAVVTGTNSVADEGIAQMIRLRTGSYTGSGGVTIPAPTIAGEGTVIVPVTGSGGVTIPAPAISGTAIETITGSGGIAMPAPSISGTGLETITGSGGVTLPAPAIAGEGEHTEASGAEGSGGVTFPAPAISGTGVVLITGSGGVTIPAPTVSGTAVETITGTAAITIPAPTVSGTGIGGDDPEPPAEETLDAEDPAMDNRISGGGAQTNRRVAPFDDWTITMDDDAIVMLYLLRKTR